MDIKNIYYIYIKISNLAILISPTLSLSDKK